MALEEILAQYGLLAPDELQNMRGAALGQGLLALGPYLMAAGAGAAPNRGGAYLLAGRGVQAAQDAIKDAKRTALAETATGLQLKRDARTQQNLDAATAQLPLNMQPLARANPALLAEVGKRMLGPADRYKSVAGVGLVDVGGDRPEVVIEQQPKAKSRSRFEGSEVVTEELNPKTLKWEEVSRGPRWLDAPTPGRVIAPILEKVTRGETLTEHEQRAFDMYTRMNPIDQLIRNMTGGTAQQAAPPATAPRPVTGTTAPRLLPPGVTKERALSEARQAIAQGKPRAAIEQRLREWGVDPGEL